MGLFKKGIYPALAQKLIKIGQLRNSDLLDEWYEKALSFERLRRKAIKEFRRRKNLKNSEDVKKKLVLDVLRQDPNMMEVDKRKEMKRCYNCGETSHLAARCSKPRKEKREKVKIIEKIREDFSLGRE